MPIQRISNTNTAQHALQTPTAQNSQLKLSVTGLLLTFSWVLFICFALCFFFVWLVCFVFYCNEKMKMENVARSLFKHLKACQAG